MQDINRRVLVTASSKGLGKAIAYEFAMNDYDVILHGRDEEKVRKTNLIIHKRYGAPFRVINRKSVYVRIKK